MVGFKYFEHIDGKPQLTKFIKNGDDEYRLARTDRWLTSDDIVLECDNENQTYRSGFHICLSPLDYIAYHEANYIYDDNWNIKAVKNIAHSSGECWRVRYKDVVCFGPQGKAGVVVAKKIKLDRIVSHLFNNFYPSNFNYMKFYQ